MRKIVKYLENTNTMRVSKAWSLWKHNQVKMISDNKIESLLLSLNKNKLYHKLYEKIYATSIQKSIKTVGIFVESLRRKRINDSYSYKKIINNVY